MRILFYGLQNSGATLLTMVAGQRPDSIVLPDLWTMHPAPRVEGGSDVAVKATVTTSYPLNIHRNEFRPHHTFLVVRRPQDNYVSLRRKSYARHNGTVEEKFSVADSCFGNSEQFTGVFVFEEVVADPSPFLDTLAAIGWHLPDDALEFPRRPWAMEQSIWEQDPSLYERVKWGTGEARLDPWPEISLARVDDNEADSFARRHAPRLHAWYAKHEFAATPRVLRRSAQDEAALQSRAQFVRGQLHQVEGLLRVEDLERALEIAREMCDLAPEDPDVWDALARSLEATGDETSARNVWERARAVPSEEQAALTTWQAQQALRFGDADSALALVESALERTPSFGPAMLLRADLAVRQQHWGQVHEFAQAVLDAQPRSARAALLLARAYEAQGMLRQSIVTLQRCLAATPGFAPAERKLAELIKEPPG